MNHHDTEGQLPHNLERDLENEDSSLRHVATPCVRQLGFPEDSTQLSADLKADFRNESDSMFG
jgi:hypothetical protein